jgi:hypothetical protein
VASTRVAVLLWVALSGGASVASTGATSALRCGWFDNPSPANVWLHDRDGEWIVGIQGGHQAKGNWPKFNAADWVRAGAGSYGYGCACLQLRANSETREVTQILSATARPLAICRRDAAIKGMEPQNPVK